MSAGKLNKVNNFIRTAPIITVNHNVLLENQTNTFMLTKLSDFLQLDYRKVADNRTENSCIRQLMAGSTVWKAADLTEFFWMFNYQTGIVKVNVKKLNVDSGL